MNIPFIVCIQKQERENYKRFLKDYKNCKSIIYVPDTTDGSFKQRNGCWKHSKKLNQPMFWLLDDNIKNFYYFQKGKKTICNHHIVFSKLEHMIENINEPVGIISHNYSIDVPNTSLRSPYGINCKNYSSCLINTKLLDEHDIKFRLKYNEDGDLTFQVLKHGFKTIGVNFFLSGKCPTGTVKGGNTDSIYKNITENDNKMLDKFNCLKEHYPDLFENKILEMTTDKHKDGCVHHKVNYDKLCKFYKNEKNITLKTIYDKSTFYDYLENELYIYN